MMATRFLANGGKVYGENNSNSNMLMKASKITSCKTSKKVSPSASSSFGPGQQKKLYLSKPFQQCTLLRESDIDLITNIFTPKKFRKRQYFLQEGEVCKYTAFIVKGAMRQYIVDDKREEHIIRLYIENWW